MDESSPKRFRPPTEEAAGAGPAAPPVPVMPGPRPMKAPPRAGVTMAAAARAKGKGGRYPFTPQNSFADARRYLASLPGAGAGTGGVAGGEQPLQATPQPQAPAAPRQAPTLPSTEAASVAMEEAPAAGLAFNSHDITHMVAMKRMQLEDKFTSGEMSAEQSVASQEASDYDSDMELSDIDGAQKRLLLRQQPHHLSQAVSSGSSPLVMRAGQSVQRPSPRPADSASPSSQQDTITAAATSVEAAAVESEQLSPAPPSDSTTWAAAEAARSTAASILAAKSATSPSPATHRKSLADVGEAAGGNLLSCQTETRRHTISIVSGRLLADDQLPPPGQEGAGDTTRGSSET